MTKRTMSRSMRPSSVDRTSVLHHVLPPKALGHLRHRRATIFPTLGAELAAQIPHAGAAVNVAIRPVRSEGVGTTHILDVDLSKVGAGEVGARQVGPRRGWLLRGRSRRANAGPNPSTVLPGGHRGRNA